MKPQILQASFLMAQWSRRLATKVTTSVGTRRFQVRLLVGKLTFFFSYPYIGRAASITNISFHAVETRRDSILILIRRPTFLKSISSELSFSLKFINLNRIFCSICTH